MNQEIIDMLKKHAEEYTPYLDDEEYICSESCGGNTDDAANSGFDAGFVALSRQILHNLGIEYTVEEW